MQLHRTCLTAAVALALFSAGAARSQTDDTVRQETVRVGDLDLASTSDSQVLASRLEKAAQHVCASPDSSPDIRRPLDVRRQEERRCRREAVARAMSGLPAQHAEAARSQEF